MSVGVLGNTPVAWEHRMLRDRITGWTVGTFVLTLSFFAVATWLTAHVHRYESCGFPLKFYQKNFGKSISIRGKPEHELFWSELALNAAIALGISVLFASFAQKRHSASECGKCGYDLRGTLEAHRHACPECGTAVDFQRFEGAGTEPAKANV